MNSIRRSIPVATGIALVLTFAHQAFAQDATVSLDTPAQVIRGFGGLNHTTWISDLTAPQRDTAFGNGEGQLGLTILRIHLDEDSSNWALDVATAQRAVELGAVVFASPWNPPASMTEVVNGDTRLRYDMYAQYAQYLNDFYSFMKGNGVDLYSVSVQSEPDYGYSWTWWTADEILTFMKENAGSLDFRVMAPESFRYGKEMSDPILNDATALENLDILGTHLYGTQLSDFGYPLFEEKGAEKELWMTEFYTDSSTDADQWPNALDIAYSIHNSMVEAEFNAYVWWYIRRSYGFIKEDGSVSKRGYCMAQYSKFVRPGFVRVEATKNPATDIYLSAYKSDTDVVMVVINRGNSSKSLTVSVAGAGISSYEQYTTSSNKSLSDDGTVDASNGSLSVALDAQSVTTLQGSVDSTGSGGASSTGGTAGSSNGGSSNGGTAGSTNGGSSNGGTAGTSNGGTAGSANGGIAGMTESGSAGMAEGGKSAGGTAGEATESGGNGTSTGGTSEDSGAAGEMSAGGTAGEAQAGTAAEQSTPTRGNPSSDGVVPIDPSQLSDPETSGKTGACACDLPGRPSKSPMALLFGGFGLFLLVRRRHVAHAKLSRGKLGS